MNPLDSDLSYQEEYAEYLEAQRFLGEPAISYVRFCVELSEALDGDNTEENLKGSFEPAF